MGLGMIEAFNPSPCPSPSGRGNGLLNGSGERPLPWGEGWVREIPSVQGATDRHVSPHSAYPGGYRAKPGAAVLH